MRRKALKPVGLPIGIVAVDGKSVWTGDEKVNDFCQRSHQGDGMPYWNFRVLRAVLVSAAAPVCLDQAPIPAETNDMGAGWIPPSASPWSVGTGASRTTATTRSHTHWREDTGFWPRKGNGLLVCSLLRMIAYNILWLLRVVHLRSRDARAIPWRQLRDLVRDALVQMRTRANRLVLNLV